MSSFSKAHDATSRGLFAFAGGALVAAVVLYVFEVVVRYAFGAPTTWSGEAVQYALAVMIFCGLPEITRTKAHVAIDLVPDALSPKTAKWLEVFNLSVATIACAVTALVVAREALKQFVLGLMTNAANPIPRWCITGIIALGLFSAALHLVRHLTEIRR